MRMLQMNFLRAVAMRQMIKDDFNNLDVGVINPSHTGFVQADVSLWGCCNHGAKFNLPAAERQSMPAPFSPTGTMTSPGATVSSRPRKAFVAPKLRRTPRISRRGELLMRII